jgi:hypothetical protein
MLGIARAVTVGAAVIALAGLVAAVLMVRLHRIWPVIHI